jgi:hypothetical protein
MWALIIPVKPTAEPRALPYTWKTSVTVKFHQIHNPPKNLFPNFVTALFPFVSCFCRLWVIRKFSQTVSEVRRLAGFPARKKWSARRLMQHSKKLPRELEASNLEEISSIVGSFFLRADNAPDLRVWTLSRFLRVRKEVGTSSSSNPLSFRRGPRVYHAKLKIALFFETYIMPAFPDEQ